MEWFRIEGRMKGKGKESFSRRWMGQTKMGCGWCIEEFRIKTVSGGTSQWVKSFIIPQGFYNREEALFMWILTFAYVFDRGKRWSTSYNSPENVCNVQTPCGDDLGQLEFWSESSTVFSSPIARDLVIKTSKDI